jgi:hypothetical protein
MYQHYGEEKTLAQALRVECFVPNNYIDILVPEKCSFPPLQTYETYILPTVDSLTFSS